MAEAAINRKALEDLLAKPSSSATVPQACEIILNFTTRMSKDLSFHTAHYPSNQLWTTLSCWYTVLLGRIFGDLERKDPPPGEPGYMILSSTFFEPARSAIQHIQRASVGGILRHKFHTHQYMHPGSQAIRQPAGYVGFGVRNEAIALVKVFSPLPLDPGGAQGAPSGTSGSYDADLMEGMNLSSLFQIIRKSHQVQISLSIAITPLRTRMHVTRDPRVQHLVPSNSRLYAILADNTQSLPPNQRMVSMLEYYFFKFGEYAAVANIDTGGGYGPSRNYQQDRRIPANIVTGWQKFGVSGLLHGSPYNILLLEYMQQYYPHRGNNIPQTGQMIPVFDYEEEIFLIIMIEYWLNQNAVISPFVRVDQLGALPGRGYEQEGAFGYPRIGAPGQQGASRTSPPGPGWGGRRGSNTDISPNSQPSYIRDPTIVEIIENYIKPSDFALHALLITCAHLLADPALPGMITGDREYLTPALRIIQPSLFHFLRLAFTRSVTDSSAFTLSMELWLLWLQPWKAPAVLQGYAPETAAGTPQGTSTTSAPRRERRGSGTLGFGSPVNMSDETAPLSDVWRAWVLSNYSMYSVLLVAYVRRARDLPLVDVKKPSGASKATTSVSNMLQRVINVFSPALCTILTQAEIINAEITTEESNSMGVEVGSGWNNMNGGARRRSSTGTPGLNDSGERTLVEKHREAMAPHIGNKQFLLVTYKEEACKLLQEIADQIRHEENRRELERAGDYFAWIGSLVSLVYNTEKKAGEVSMGLERTNKALRRIFSISPHWQVSEEPVDGSGGRAQDEDGPPDRIAQGTLFLSDTGINQIKQGVRHCSPVEVDYIGDPMLRPLESAEISLLAELLVSISTYINNKYSLPKAVKTSNYMARHRVRKGVCIYIPERVYKYGLDAVGKFRVNLRFFADKRNLLAFMVVLLLWYFYKILFTTPRKYDV